MQQKPARKPAPRKKKKKNAGKKRLWLIPAAILAAVLAFGCILKFSGRIYPNVSVCGADVGGLSREEATRVVQAVTDETYGSRDMNIELPDRTVTIRADAAAVTVDVDGAVDTALAYGRSGGPIGAIVNWIRCRGEQHDVDAASALQFDEAYLRELTESTANAVESPLRQSSVSYNEEGGTLTVTRGTARRHLEAQDLYKAIVAAYGAGQFEGATCDYAVTEPDPVDLKTWFDTLCTPASDARYDEKTHEFTEEVIGYGFDLEAEEKRVADAEEGETVVITLGEVVPEVTLESLMDEYFSDTLASYDSPHTAIAARTNNLILACAEIDGTILNPGEVFSFNGTVGERTADRGFKAATVYVTGGASEPELGGGVCQVASTIYMCTLLADLEVVERTEHMFAVTYVPMGMDATVYWGSLDFKFRNSTSHPLLMRASVSDGYVHIKLLGTKETDETVKMTYDVLATLPWQEVEKVDESKQPGFRETTVTPYTGYRVQTYKERYDKDGNLLKTEKCAYSSYRKRDKIITVGPEEAPPEETTEPVTTEPVETVEPVTPVEPAPAPVEPAPAPVEPAPAPSEPAPAETPTEPAA